MKMTNSIDEMTVAKNSFRVFSEPITSSTVDSNTNRRTLFNSKLLCEWIFPYYLSSH